uniref:TNF receptor superfamily member 11a n=1 Tax=Coturnix japonica TaxID=93934 RepID=A0A8C2U2A8_COTJA
MGTFRSQSSTNKRCARQEPPEFALPQVLGSALSLQSTLPCESEQHYEYSGRCCKKCEPGKYMSAKCTETSDSVCQPCGPNEYMDVWNEEDKCLLHKICDQGKALKEVNPGNSTFQRQCACTTGYHWNEDCDCCQRNTICAPGFGIGHPVQQDKDTRCMPCPRGYFSEVASSTDECKSWTNNMLMVLSFLHLTGTNKILYVLIVISFFVALIGIVIFIVYYKNKGKKLTAACLFEPPRDAYVTVNITNTTIPQLTEDMRLLGPAGSPAPGSSPCGHSTCRHGSPGMAPCRAGGTLQEISVGTETDDDHFSPVPTEDEYMDKDLNTADYLPLLSQPDGKTLSLFSEPVEVGENDSLNQCFSGIGSTEDVSIPQGSDPSSDADGVHATMDKYLQKSCQLSHGCPKEIDSKDTDRFAMNRDSEKICVRCGISYRETPRKGSRPCCAAVDGSIPVSRGKNHGTKAELLQRIEFTMLNILLMRENINHACLLFSPPPSPGNVTGNSNSTFISSGQVMNFKGDIIVVYLSQNSQEGAAASGAAEENVSSPVQEENSSRCENFAGNAQHYKEKCAELHATIPVGNGGTWHHTAPVPSLARRSEPTPPVQEEGRLGHSSEKVLN